MANFRVCIRHPIKLFITVDSAKPWLPAKLFLINIWHLKQRLQWIHKQQKATRKREREREKDILHVFASQLKRTKKFTRPMINAITLETRSVVSVLGCADFIASFMLFCCLYIISLDNLICQVNHQRNGLGFWPWETVESFTRWNSLFYSWWTNSEKNANGKRNWKCKTSFSQSRRRRSMCTSNPLWRWQQTVSKETPFPSIVFTLNSLNISHQLLI